MNKIIMQQPNRRETFFQQVLSRGKEGVILFQNMFTWRIALSREILLAIRHLANNDIELSYEDWENFFSIYILNLNNDTNRNPNIRAAVEDVARSQFINWIRSREIEELREIDFLTQVNNFFEQNPNSIGVHVQRNFSNHVRLHLVPWDNQMSINECQ